MKGQLAAESTLEFHKVLRIQFGILKPKEIVSLL